jgi:hypothetical protein
MSDFAARSQRSPPSKIRTRPRLTETNRCGAFATQPFSPIYGWSAGLIGALQACSTFHAYRPQQLSWAVTGNGIPI